jgi:hypothetical protein
MIELMGINLFKARFSNFNTCQDPVSVGKLHNKNQVNSMHFLSPEFVGLHSRNAQQSSFIEQISDVELQ